MKNSLLISVLPNVISDDFGHFSRNLPPGTDIIPFEAEHYTTCLQGVFTISLTDVGRFTLGEMYDLSKDIVQGHEMELRQDEDESQVYWLPKEKRAERVKQVIQALADLRGGARLARNLSDVRPVAVLIGFLDGGNAPFQRLFKPDENNENICLNLERLRSILEDYKDRVLEPADGGKALYFGCRATVLANEKEVLKAFKEESPFKECIEVLRTPKMALKRVADLVRPMFDRHLP